MDDRVQESPSAGRFAAPAITVTRYRRGRFWADWLYHELLAVTVYRKGAEAVVRELERRAPT
ncbi:MAG: hypothetical protein PF961_11755 [Planctomycetota bacterium]|jgi:hypothetical protein|nr:hypothetical protein [Planctomycetota bacterium]